MMNYFITNEPKRGSIPILLSLKRKPGQTYMEVSIDTNNGLDTTRYRLKELCVAGLTTIDYGSRPAKFMLTNNGMKIANAFDTIRAIENGEAVQ